MEQATKPVAAPDRRHWGRRRARNRLDGGHRDMGIYTAMRALGVVVLGVLTHDAFKV
jgi:hypothetical protein